MFLAQGGSAATAQEQFPYPAVVTGTDVRVRSGPSDKLYYPVMVLNRGDRVTVVGERFGWSEILPPKGSFSLIAKSKVTVGSDGKTGRTTEKVYAYAGTKDPRRAFAVQSILAEGAEVVILGESDGYYRIAPPKDARLWMSSKYLRKSVVGTPATRPSPEGGAAAPTPALRPIESIKKEIDRTNEELRIEQVKPLAQQNLEPFVERFEQLARKAKGHKATEIYCQKYVEALLEKIRDQQRVRELGKVRADLEKREEKLRLELDRMRQRLASSSAERGFEPTAVGRLEKSYIFTGDMLEKWYRLVDPRKRRTVAYVRVPTGASLDLSRYLGKLVGVVGERRYDADKAVEVITVKHVATFAASRPATRSGNLAE